jgi:hypothetical protein
MRFAPRSRDAPGGSHRHGPGMVVAPGGGQAARADPGPRQAPAVPGLCAPCAEAGRARPVRGGPAPG